MKHMVYRENGYQIILIPMPMEKSVFVRSTIHGGNSAETKKTSGIAHLMEHALTDAWKTCSYNDHQKCREYWEDKGTISNAYTGDNEIVYFIQGKTAHCAEMIEYIVAISSAPFISTKVINEEKAPVLNELLSYKNETYSRLKQERYEMIYNNEGLKHYENYEVQIKNLKNLNRKEIVKYFRDVYTPHNVSFVVAGNINVSLAKKQFKELLKNAKHYTKYKPEEINYQWQTILKKPFLEKGNEFRCLLNPKTDKTQINIWYTIDACDLNGNDIYFPMFKHLFTSGFSSLLLKHLRTKLNLIYHVHLNIHSGPYALLIEIKTSCVPKNTEKVIGEIRKKLRELCKNIDTKMFKNAKQIYELEFLNTKKTSKMVGDFYANQYFYKKFQNKSIIYSPEKQLNAIKSVTKIKMSKVLCQLFTQSNVKIICEGPTKVNIDMEG